MATKDIKGLRGQDGLKNEKTRTEKGQHESLIGIHLKFGRARINQNVRSTLGQAKIAESLLIQFEL